MTVNTYRASHMLSRCSAHLLVLAQRSLKPVQVMQDHVRQVDKLTHRKVPVVWYGIAQQVQLMGSFDSWTQGFTLSADDIHDGTFTKFQATLSLPPVRCFFTSYFRHGICTTRSSWFILFV